jgi:hypothetical protein
VKDVETAKQGFLKEYDIIKEDILKEDSGLPLLDLKRNLRT